MSSYVGSMCERKEMKKMMNTCYYLTIRRRKRKEWGWGSSHGHVGTSQNRPPVDHVRLSYRSGAFPLFDLDDTLLSFGFLEGDDVVVDALFGGGSFFAVWGGDDGVPDSGGVDNSGAADEVWSNWGSSKHASGFFRRNSIARWVANVCVAPVRNSRYLVGLRVIRGLSRLGLRTGSWSPIISGLRLCQKWAGNRSPIVIGRSGACRFSPCSNNYVQNSRN